MSRAAFWASLVLVAVYVAAIIATHPTCPAGSVADIGRYHWWRCVIVVQPVHP